ncbi:cobalamin 5''-phosphate synthase/cobalamin synthase [Thioflavicoccus mobilis 8321]|uniref:Adenosylcobinamide-GDP ribazoletransferase n=1 Tax=Thioflavicoccus mobilis 8321 TaxID=765912 RepID=L0H2C7_9GAMM|nr:adenosylcobinamide-GDP ribazoletransferase [Thioflavicoccus mobilis]AGA91805.1 cobalamin 5''-phosphate synthase/cobalamin synthase [Thioflavicoccus mobilis 8321]
MGSILLRACLIACRFLTRLPLPDPGVVDEPEVGRSALFYPLVGLLIGAPLWLAAVMLDGAPVVVAAVLVLCLWVWVTGGLHLDGLGDSADGWLGGIGSRERTLEIMRDPRAGAMAVIAIGLLLLTKWSALQALLTMGHAAYLLWIPLLARAVLVLALLTTPYARPQGMASASVAYLPRPWARIAIAAALLVVLMLGGAAGLLAIATALGLFLGWRRLVMERLNGFTGDTAGALVELAEGLVLIVLVLVPL